MHRLPNPEIPATTHISNNKALIAYTRCVLCGTQCNSSIHVSNLLLDTRLSRACCVSDPVSCSKDTLGKKTGKALSLWPARARWVNQKQTEIMDYKADQCPRCPAN